MEKKVSEIPRNYREFIESNNAFHRLCFINNFLRGGHFNRLHKWSGVHSRGLKFGPIAEANHNAKSTLGCDPVGILGPKSLRFDSDQDYGWSDGAEGSGKCYMLIKNFDYRFDIISNTLGLRKGFKKNRFFLDLVLNYGWVGVKSPKLFSENTHSVICTANIQ